MTASRREAKPTVWTAPPPPQPVFEPEPLPPPTPTPDPDEEILNPPPRRERGVVVSGGRIHVSLGTVGVIVVAAVVCVVAIGAYSAGRRSALVGQPGTLALARAPQVNPLTLPPTPPTEVEQKLRDAALSGLMKPPALTTPAEQSAAPAASPMPPAAATAEKPLHFLQIDTFRYGRATLRASVHSELADARKFLEDRGLKTIVRDTGKEFILLSAEPVTSTKEPSAVQFQTRVEALGREYRKAGGRYEFKGCFWRSESTLPGRPVESRREQE